MKIIWIGQAGLLLEKDNYKIMIDPYLSDSVERINSQNYRRVEVNQKLFDICPDMMIFTHNHLDHYDPETIEKFITQDSNITVLAPLSVWNEVRKIGEKIIMLCLTEELFGHKTALKLQPLKPNTAILTQ